MAENVTCLMSVDTVKNIMNALDTNHRAFPVLNLSGNASGVIPRNYIITMLKKLAFYEE